MERLREHIGSYERALGSGGHGGLKISERLVCVACVANRERQCLLAHRRETWLAVSRLANLATVAGLCARTLKL